MQAPEEIKPLSKKSVCDPVRGSGVQGQIWVGRLMVRTYDCGLLFEGELLFNGAKNM